MTRDELLTRLAMSLGEWPAVHNNFPPTSMMPAGSSWERSPVADTWHARATKGDMTIDRHEWLAERERLIDKPNWRDAPEWANWLAQDADGTWYWFGEKPYPYGEEFVAKDPLREVRWGQVPAGHDWRQTLECRPDDSGMWVYPAKIVDSAHDDHAEDEAFRECERRLADQQLADDLSASTGMKFDDAKPRMDLLFDMPRALTAVGQVLTYGAGKYAPRNWQHVEDAEYRYKAAALRHDIAWSSGEVNDPESGLHHLAHKVCCDLFRLELALREGHRAEIEPDKGDDS